MQVSNSTLSGPSGPLGFNYSSTRFTTDANGEARFTEVMGSAKQKYIESSPESKAVTLSDKAVALSSQEADDEDADLSLLVCWTPDWLARFANQYTEAEQYEQLKTWVFNDYSPGFDCSDYINGGDLYYATTRIPVTPESEMIDKKQSNAFVADLKSMYAVEMSKGSSAMDIYKKIGRLILSQPDDFAYKFGFSVKFREKVESMPQWGGHGDPFEEGGGSFSFKYDPPGESKDGALMQAKDGFSRRMLLQMAHDMERHRQYILMDLLYRSVNQKPTLISGL
ncbi:hypothetical protein [Achromobacter xylosoxidans]|uniref:hypothetical protein n=1 Tax=Alcaligenes xylosoxydans xylosoxydans TaxID=85698 RepID=UPI0006C36A63|nr:hypothetical protein [Achromobacter xylosoxidans]CUI47622.1 Uncharacterised protein [Achromobacter xylosoxidans]